MLRLAVLVYIFVGTTMAGSFVVAALAMGRDTLWPILIAAGLGFGLAIPAALAIARAILSNRR